jgi:hypothetical protein
MHGRKEFSCHSLFCVVPVTKNHQSLCSAFYGLSQQFSDPLYVLRARIIHVS